MNPREGTVRSDGVDIHYRDWGGDGPPLILSHATGFLGAVWRPVAEALSPRFRVIAQDQRGCGDSGPLPRRLTFEDLVGDLAALIESLDIETAVAAGHSAGATITAIYAARHPWVIRRAVLIEPILPRPEWVAAIGPNSLAERARRRRARWASREHLFDSFRSRPPFDAWREDVLRIYVEEGTRPLDDGRVELKCLPQVEAQFYEAAVAFDPWPDLARLPCPALLVWGERSDVAAVQFIESVEEAIPDARTICVPGAGHFLPMEQPEAVARLIEGFLAN